MRDGMARLIGQAAILAILLVPAAAPAQERPADTPGQFDFYVLSLSWSPSFCASAAGRRDGRDRGGDYGGRSATRQCGARPYSFVVHGLWPQYDKGFPENCQDPAPRLDHRLVGAMLDLMPAPRLIYNEWDKHGTCSGLDAKAYFDTVRKARAAVTIPADYADPQTALTVTPGAVEAAFIKANPTLPADGMAVICSGKRLSEVRLCLAKDLKFRACPEVAKRGCRSDLLLMPPVRGNND
ncbi:MAG: ribonuclease T2 [Xanthobacteraceae bacterium]